MINRRRFVQGVSAAALAAKPIATMAETWWGSSCPDVSVMREDLDPAYRGDLGEVTHIFVYTESLTDERLTQYAGMAHSLFGEAPITTFPKESVCEDRRHDHTPQVMLCYSNGRRLVYQAVSGKTASGDQMWIYGTAGSLNISLQR
ncbi:hypothetical protein [Edaphobacter flagellatus]|uniref:hypothetical protein n=1 Tax=Edaphobacter flagellatus TaxID=1933044 RepID=UPI0021B298E7|nr:hypothetical protein [Edaphobacter flagellatus]